MRRLLSCVATSLVLALLLPAVSSGQEKGEPSIKVRLLMQPQAQTDEKGSPNGTWDHDFFLRRARIILAGNVNEWVHFFYETDNPNFGQDGDFKKAFFTQDAYVDFQFAKEFCVAAGLILLPFTHHTRQSAASLNTLDYHNMFSGGEYGLVTSHVWRDVGIEARGFFADKLEYRLGVYNGLRGPTTTPGDKAALPGAKALNPDDLPRFVGRVAVNLFDIEDAFFYGGTYLGAKKIVTVGFGADIQPDATYDEKGNLATYSAMSADLFVDWPLNDKMEVTGQVAGVWFDRGQKVNLDLNTQALSYLDIAGTGFGMFGDLGFRYGAFQPTIGGERFASDVDGKDFMNYRGGLNYWIKGHNANLKLEYAALGTEKPNRQGEFDYASQITLQGQLLF